MMLCCLHDGFNGTVGLSLSQVFLESISEDGQLAIGLEATEGFLGLQQAGGGPSERHLGVSPAFDVAGDLAAGGIDGGPWAETMREVRLLVNAEAMRKAETTFQAATNYKGEMAAAAYLRSNSSGFFSSSRMPATASTIAQCIRYRAGTMGMDGVNAARTATCPVWNHLGIDDIFSDSASGTQHFTLHALIGDVLITQASAYERVDMKLST